MPDLDFFELDGQAGIDASMDTDKNLKTKMVSIYEIAFNPLNNMQDTEEDLALYAENIYQEGGVRSPLNVYVHREDGKRYRLLGGYRRLNALLINAKRYPDAQKYVSVIIEPAPVDELDEEIKILELNEHRNLDDEQTKRLVERYLRVYRELESRNQKPEGQVRNWIAMKMSIGQKRAEKYIHEIEGRKRKPSEKKQEAQKSKECFYDDLRHHVEKIVGTKVKITGKSISFAYTDENDMNRILEILGLLYDE